jgi:4'-phosphopantetheinyl transferase
MVKGKPVLDPNIHNQTLDFSSAGSNGCCLFGISTSGQVGVDLEEEGRMAGRPLALVRRYFSAAEKEVFGKMKRDTVDRAFLHTWACKEAVVKAAGHGIANQLCRFTVNTDPDKPAAMLDINGDRAGAWQLEMVKPVNGFIGSVALKRHPPEDQGQTGLKLCLDGFSLSRRPAEQDT